MEGGVVSGICRVLEQNGMESVGMGESWTNVMNVERIR